MTNKENHISRMIEMQKKIKELSNADREPKTVPLQPKIEVEQLTAETETTDTLLPTKYLSIKQLKLSTKELANTTSFLDKMNQIDDKYDVQISEEKANKIRKEMIRLTTGVSAVVPLQCKGSQCSFSSTCVTGDTVILGKKDKKIKDIIIGDIVYSFNLSTKRVEKDTVTDIKVIKNKKVYLITTWYGNKIKATADHPVLTINDSLTKFTWKSIQEGLTKNDKVLISDLEDEDDDLESVGDVFVDKILSITELSEQDVYDITVKKNSNFFANNVVVHNCPYFLNDVAPIKKPCPVESQLLEYWMEKYKNEFKIDDNQLTDLHAVGRLCTFDIYEMRLTRYLSEHDQTLLVDFISSYDEQGNPVSNKATSAAWDTIDKIDRMRSKTLKELMATREAKTKLIQTVNETHKINSLSALKAKFEEIIRQQTGSVTVEGSSKEVK